MDSKPLSYDSLKTILQYMEANKRFQISHRIPSTRTADRVTPLFINKLGFDGYDVTINNVEYTLRTFIDNWEEPDTNIKIHGESTRGRFKYDIDRFGLQDFATEAEATPGDLVAKERITITDNTEHREEILASLEEKLQKAKTECSENNRNVDDCHRVENLQSSLIPFQCSRDNKPLPYEIHVYLEFSQNSSSRLLEDERLSYNRTLPEAMKYLTTKFFGNRKNPIKVTRLENDFHDRTIRLPVDLKMEVRELQTYRMTGATQLLPVIQNSKLDIFRIDWIREEDFEVELPKATQLLVLDCFLVRYWLPHAQNLANQHVLFINIDNFEFESYILLMKHWIENGREARTCFSFSMDKGDVNRVERMVIEQFGGFTIAMRNKCKLVVSFEEKPLERPKEYCGRWRMKIEVVE